MVGRFFGKHKLCAARQPEKDRRGLYRRRCDLCFVLRHNGAHRPFCRRHGKCPFAVYIAMGLFGGIFAVIGDLSASVVKRNYNIKDYGKLIPGHGGHYGQIRQRYVHICGVLLC